MKTIELDNKHVAFSKRNESWPLNAFILRIFDLQYIVQKTLLFRTGILRLGPSDIKFEPFIRDVVYVYKQRCS